MTYSKAGLLEALRTDTIHESFFVDYEESMDEYERLGAHFLEDDFMEKIEREHGFLSDRYDFVMEELRRVRNNDVCARYSFLLYKMLLRSAGQPPIRLSGRPKAESPALKTDFEMAAYFALLALAPEAIAEYERRALPEDVRYDTMRSCFGTSVRVGTDTERGGFNDDVSFWWNQHYVRGNIIRVGILNFQVNSKFERDVTVFKSTRGEYKILPTSSGISACGLISGSAGYPDREFYADVTESDDAFVGYEVDTGAALVTAKRVTLMKNEWHKALQHGDEIVGLHISGGVKLTPERCREAFLKCTDILRKCFPERRPKAFYCTTWLLDPQLEKMLPKSSNIVNFGRQFLRFPVCSGGKSVFTFLFKRPFGSFDQLPEKTTLEREVKAHYIAGKYIYDTGGVIFGYGI